MAFGRELQRERERRGISIDAVADGTKVSPRYLRALESDDVRNLPGGIFNKGFVRSYCRFLGLNEDEWLQRFARTAPATTEDADWTEFAENVKRTRIQTAPAMRRRWWGVVLMLIVLAALGWAMWQYLLRARLQLQGDPVRPTTPVPVLSTPPSAPAPAVPPSNAAPKSHKPRHVTPSAPADPASTGDPAPSTNQ